MDKFKVAVKCDFGTYVTEVEAADVAEAFNKAEAQFIDKFGTSTISSSLVKEGF